MGKTASKNATVPEGNLQPKVDLLFRRHRQKMQRWKVRRRSLLLYAALCQSSNGYSHDPSDIFIKTLRCIGKVEGCENTSEAHSKLQTQHNITDGRRGETVWRCPYTACPTPSLQYSSKIGTGLGQSGVQPHEESKWLDCYVHGCLRNSCFDDADILPIKYPSPGKPCVPEYVQPCPPSDRNRRPRLPEAPEMLCTLKQGIRHPFQISQRRKEMQTHLDKLTDEHQAFAFPPGTRAFVDDAYYATASASTLVENYDIVRRDIGMQKFPECTIRPYLLAFHSDKYAFFRERLPMSWKRILDIPSNRTLHWHNWVVRSLRTTYSESWRKDIKVPENWFGPEIEGTC